MWDFIEEFASMIVIVVLLGAVVFGIKLFEVNCIDNIPSKVYVDGKLIYEGSSAGFDVHSSGYATTVTLSDGFLYMFPKAVYTSKDVRVEGSK